jgi:cysteine-rich repeat protein
MYIGSGDDARKTATLSLQHLGGVMKSFLLWAPLLPGCLLVSGLVTQECGDGFVDAQEECDDGNDALSDNCDTTCNRELVFTMDDINGANANNARFAVYLDSLVQKDVNQDGSLDTDIAQLEIYITDQPDAVALCSALAEDPLAFNSLPDLEGFRLLIIKEDLLDKGGFADTEELSTTVNFGSAVLFPAPDQVYVGAGVTKRSDGINALLADNSAFEVNNGNTSLSFAPDGLLSGSLQVNLTADRSGLVPFDTVEDFIFVDGEPDFFAIDTPVDIQFNNVQRCN